MKVFAYCAASFQQSVKQAAGVQPLLSPPVTAESFEPAQLEGHDFIYFKLHGLPEQVYWFGDHWLTALRATQILAANLRGTVIFVANCSLTQTNNGRHPTAPMLTPLLAAGARCVVGGIGDNFARSYAIHGADRLGRAFRYLLQFGFTPYTAFRLARAALRAKPHKAAADLDALKFRYFAGETKNA